jgi:hypothetical protein
MTSYTITISPNDNSGSSTTLVVETHAQTVRITDVHLHAGAGLSDGHLPAIDFAQLLRAVRPPVTRAVPAGLAAEPATAAIGEVPEPSRPRASRRTATATAAGRGVRPAKATGNAKARQNTDAPTTSPAGRATKSTRKTDRQASATGRRSRGAAAPAAAPDGGGRAYRRMPADIREVMVQASTAAALADHYQVPTHTARSWLQRVRRENDAT